MPTVFIVSGTSTNIPADWGPVNTVGAIGGGGSGNMGSFAPGSAGAGAYYCAIANEANTGGASITIAIGAGGNGVAGGDTSWKASPTVLARGGGSGTSNVGTTQNAGGAAGTQGAFTGGAGGGGAGGATGVGKAGGTSINSASRGGSGGGGANAGSSTAGSANSGTNGGNGGLGPSGTAGGTGGVGSGTPGGNGSQGSGGGGAAGAGGTLPSVLGGNGGAGIDWDATHGSGGGGGGGGWRTGGGGTGGTGGLYGGGAGGGGYSDGCSIPNGNAGLGAQGIITLIYTAATNTMGNGIAAAALIAALSTVNWPYQFLGGAQPYAAKKLNPSQIAVQVDDPPFAHRERTPQQNRLITQASQPDPWVYNTLGDGAVGPYMPSRLAGPVKGVQLDNPPFSQRNLDRGSIVVQAWQPDPWVYNYAGPVGGTQPYAPRKLPPQIILIPADPPPIQHPGRTVQQTAIAVQAAQPDPWVFTYAGPAGGTQPYAPKQLNPSISAVPEDNPPFRHSARTPQVNVPVAQWQPEIWPYVFTGAGATYRQPYGINYLTPSIHGIVRDDPQFTHPMRRPVYMALNTPWQPDPWVYSYAGQAAGTQPFAPRKLNPSITAVPENNPPFGIPNVSISRTVLNYWQPEMWPYAFMGNRQAYQGRQLVPGVPGQSIDEPPFRNPGRVPAQMAVVNQQQPDPWTYTFMGGAGPFMPNTNASGIPGSSTDNPPFRNPGRIPQTMVPIYQWQPEVWPYIFMGGLEPYEGKHLPPSVIAVPVRINYRLTVRNVIVRTRIVNGNPWPGPGYPPKNNA